jgi:stress-induced morphogen
MEELKKQFTETMTDFIEKCIPLTISNKELYFLSSKNTLFGFDIKQQSFFEPNSTERFKIINQAITESFNQTHIHSFNTIYNHPFSELIELKIKQSGYNKYTGLKAFYSKERDIIYVWNFFENKWSTQDSKSNRQYFSNNEIILNEITDTPIQQSKHKITYDYYETLEDLKINETDLVKIPNIRLGDASTHYKCDKLNCIVSFNFVNKYWYIYDKEIQKKILSLNE